MDIQHLLATSDRTPPDVNNTQELPTLNSTSPFLPLNINSSYPRSPDIFAPEPSNHQYYQIPSSYYLSKDLRNSLLNSGASIAPWKMNPTTQSQPKFHAKDEEDAEVLEAARILMGMRRDQCDTDTYIDAGADGHVEGAITNGERQRKESLFLLADSDQTTIAGTPDSEAYFQTAPSPDDFMVELGDISSYEKALPQSIATRNHMNLLGFRPTPSSTSPFQPRHQRG